MVGGCSRVGHVSRRRGLRVGLGAGGRARSSRWRSRCDPTSQRDARSARSTSRLIAVAARVSRATGADAGEWIRSIDPHAIAVRTQPVAAAALTPPNLPWIPITIAPHDTLAAAGILLSSIVMFWTCRRVCEQGGTGRSCEPSPSSASSPRSPRSCSAHRRIDLLYGVWRPQDTGARPYGPFVNRNHLATWIIMACPLAFGYLLARAPPQ